MHKMKAAYRRMIYALNPRHIIGDHSNHGMVLVMALSVILLISTVALEIHISERSNMRNTVTKRDRIMLEEMTISGIHLAMAVLIKDRIDSTSDSLQEDWADEETIKTLLEQIPFEKGKLDVKIVDEMGKIQINALVQFPEGHQFNIKQRQLWERLADQLLSLLELMNDDSIDMEETDPPTIINSIKDWIDKDVDLITGLSGAESDYYEELDPPYACKNGPFDHLSEVRLVKGITPELFNGAGGSSGLNDFITVYGAQEQKGQKFSFSGKVNINTAELPVLTVLLPSENEDFANLLIEYREALSGDQYTHDLTQINWYKNVPGFSETTLDADLITISSDVFRITASAEIDGTRATTTAIVRRERKSESSPWQCKVLNWKAE